MKRIIPVLSAALCLVFLVSCSGTSAQESISSVPVSKTETAVETFEAGYSIHGWEVNKNTIYRFYSDGNIEYLPHGKERTTQTSEPVGTNPENNGYTEYSVIIDTSSAVIVSSGKAEPKTYTREDDGITLTETLNIKPVKVKVTVSGYTNPELAGKKIIVSPDLFLSNNYETARETSPGQAVIQEDGRFEISVILEGNASIDGYNRGFKPYYSISRFYFE